MAASKSTCARFNSRAARARLAEVARDLAQRAFFDAGERFINHAALINPRADHLDAVALSLAAMGERLESLEGRA